MELARDFGKMGSYYYDIVRGIDDRPVNPSRVRKSIGVERTLDHDLSSLDEIESILLLIVDQLMERLKKADNYGRTITLKIKTSDFQSLTRSLSKDHFLKDTKEICLLALKLLRENRDAFEKIRLIGLTASNLEKEEEKNKDHQLSLDWE